MQVFLVFGLIFFSLSSYATNDCSDYIRGNYSEINRTNMGFKDSLFAELPIINEIKYSDSSEEIVKKFNVSNNSAFTFKVSCNNVSSIFFSVYIGGEKVEFMDGVILLRADNYFSGPHSLVNSKEEVVIIQADKQ